jgi:PST family polysaccharide transporter
MRWNVFGRVGTQAIRLGVSVVLARFLVPQDFGLMAMAYVVAAFLQVFIDFGTGYAIIQRRQISRELLSSVFFLNLLVGTACAAAVFWASEPLAAAFSEAQLAALLQALSVTFLLSASAIVHRALLMRNMRFDRLIKATILGTVAFAAVGITLGALGFGVWALVGGTIAEVTVSTPVLWYAARWRPHAHFAISDLRPIARFSVNLSAYNVYNYFSTQSDKIIISWLLGAGPLGLYALAQRLTSSSIRPIAAAVDPVIFSRMAQLQDDDQEIGEAFLRTVGGIALILFPAMIGASVIAEPLILTLLGETWRPVAPLVAVLAPITALNAIVERTGSIFRAKGRTDLLLRWEIARSIVIAVAYLAGTPWGITGVVNSFALGCILLAPVMIWIPFRLIGLRFTQLARTLLACVFATFTMAAGAGASRLLFGQLISAPAVVVVVSVAVGALIYAGSIWVLRPPALDDLLQSISLRRATSPDHGSTQV